MDDSFFKEALEIFKAFTPFIIAIAVYLLWHSQKEKEVIAAEAKILIKKLNELFESGSELYKLPNRIFTEVHHSEPNCNGDFAIKFDELVQKHIDKYNSYQVQVKEIRASLSFIELALNDSGEPSERCDNFDESIAHYMIALHDLLFLEDSDDSDENFEDPVDRFLAFRSHNISELTNSHHQLIYDINKLKNYLLEYALYRNKGWK